MKICFCEILYINSPERRLRGLTDDGFPIIVLEQQSLLYQQIHFHQIKSKMTGNNMSNVHVSPDVLSTLPLLQQGNIYKLQQKILHGISRSSCPEVLSEKKTTRRIQRKTLVLERPATLLKRDSNTGVLM